MPEPILFRTDASSEIGTGHLMRCLALAQALKAAGRTAAFACFKITPALQERLTQEGMQLVVLTSPHDEEETTAMARHMGATWIVVDGYHFDARYQNELMARGLHVFSVDDYAHADRYTTDAVLNQNLYATEEMYRNRGERTRLLLGTRFTLLRNEFRAWASWNRDTRKKAKKILVTLGGSDPENVTGKILQSLATIANAIDVTVVVGGSNRHLPEIQAAAAQATFPIDIAVNVADMPERMSRADVAISAGGSTCYELCLLQVPMITVVLADNQEAVAVALDKAVCAINLGRAERFDGARLAREVASLLGDPERRAAMAAKEKSLVDTEGADRVAMLLLDEKLRLRRARDSDAELLFGWANDPAVRASSFSPDPIAWEDHWRWFTEKLADKNCLIYVGINDQDEPVGQIRFDVSGTAADVDVHVAPDRRGQGYGSALIAQGVRTFFAAVPGATVVNACAKQENEASAQSFLKAGFHETGTEDLHGCPVRCFSLERP